MTQSDPREIILSISGSPLQTFRKFLLHKGITGMDVKKEVKLYSDEGFKMSQPIEPENPYAAFSKVFDAGSSLRAAGRIATMIKGASKVGKVATSAGAAVSATQGMAWTPWLKNVMAFKDAKAFTTQITFKFNMGQFGLWDAKEEVYKPIMNLMALFLPLGIHGINIIPHLKTTTQTIYSFIGIMMKDFKTAGGTSIFTDMKNSLASKKGEGISLDSTVATLDSLFAKLSTGLGSLVVSTIESADQPTSFYNVDLSYASDNFTLRRMQPTTCDVTFSNKEYDSNGYPIEGQIVMNFQSYQPATVAGISENRINFGFIK